LALASGTALPIDADDKPDIGRNQFDHHHRQET